MTSILLAAIVFIGMRLMWWLGYRAGRRSLLVRPVAFEVASPKTDIRYSGAWVYEDPTMTTHGWRPNA